MLRPAKKLVLETGQEFYGTGFGADCRKVCELVFNTSVVGYQEIISDPSYAGQIVVMTYPLIGNYGIADEDYESRSTDIGGLIVRECCDTPSNFRSTKTLEEELEDHGIPCLSGVDTRMITKIIRETGRPMAAIVEAEMPREEALALIATTERPKDLLRRVSCRKRWVTRTSNHRFHVVAVDCGIKQSILTCLKQRGCNVTVVPFNTPAKDILAFNPDGVLLSNGPVSALEAPEIRALFAEIKGRVPVLGIGLGTAYLVGRMAGRAQRQASPQPEQQQAAQPKQEPVRSTSQRVKPVEKKSYGPEIDPIVEEGNKALSEMGRLYMSIQDTEVRSKINEIMRITDKIVQDAIQDPSDIPQIKKFMNYYLPTTIKLLNAYDRMSSLGVEGENIDKSMKNINEMLDAAILAYKKRLDSLFANQALDIETDIDVMNQMLAREGLSENKDFVIQPASSSVAGAGAQAVHQAK